MLQINIPIIFIDKILNHKYESFRSLMHQAAIEKYLEQLMEIKRRGNAFRTFSSEITDAIFDEAAIEIATLQLRKILEILAFGFVLTIGEKAIPAYANFTKYKNTEEFFSLLSKLNSNFYPSLIIQEKDDQGQMLWSSPTVNEYLTADNFVTLFEHCNQILEPRLVGAKPIALEECRLANLDWYRKIVRLLNAHLVHLDYNDVVYLFQMGFSDAVPTCKHFRAIKDNKDVNVGKIEIKSNESQTNISLIDHLQRQLEFLRRSCELFDVGYLDEAVRIAVCIRILIHDTEKSKSILQQLNVKNQVKLATSFSFDFLPRNFQPTSILPLFLDSSKGGTSVPFPLSTPLTYKSVDEWWEETVWMQKNTLTRKDIILKTAHKEGGAHADAMAPEEIQELRKGLLEVSSIKVHGIEVGTPRNHHFLLIRQFAHELLNSESLISLNQ